MFWKIAFAVYFLSLSQTQLLTAWLGLYCLHLLLLKSSTSQLFSLTLVFYQFCPNVVALVSGISFCVIFCSYSFLNIYSNFRHTCCCYTKNWQISFHLIATTQSYKDILHTFYAMQIFKAFWLAENCWYPIRLLKELEGVKYYEIFIGLDPDWKWYQMIDLFFACQIMSWWPPPVQLEPLPCYPLIDYPEKTHPKGKHHCSTWLQFDWILLNKSKCVVICMQVVIPVKLEHSCTMIIPLDTVSVLWTSIEIEESFE